MGYGIEVYLFITWHQVKGQEQDMVLYVDGKGERGKKMTSFKMQSLKGLLIAYRRRKDKKKISLFLAALSMFMDTLSTDNVYPQELALKSRFLGIFV